MENVISPSQLKGAFILGVKRLDENKELINELNVFPVPDGDTGTNMSMTVNSALNEVEKVEFDDVQSLCKVISQGSLRGARGNSGVILSQLFRGFHKVIKSADHVDLHVLADAFNKATETAYRAVMKPKEGTILTIAKAISDEALSLCNDADDVVEFFDGLLDTAKATLEKTPEMLPVLKQAGVVDSGGAGLICILEGACDYISGRDTDITINKEGTNKKGKEVSYKYEVSFNLYPTKEIGNKELKDLEKYLAGIGKLNKFEKESTYIGIDILSNEPGKAINRGVKEGELDGISINNINPSEKRIKLKIESEPPKELKNFGFISVTTGDGLKEIFESLGADYCIEGGQTMNPSTEDIINAIEKVYAKEVFILPNNKNILLAANQAAEITNDKKVYVIPTVTIPQGICALINYSEDLSAKENIDNITEELNYIKSGEVTYAIRDTKIDNKTIKEGDFMGIGDSGILSVEKNISKCVEKLVEELVDEDSALLSIYFGADIKESEAKKLCTRLGKKFSDLDIDLQNGGQPVYSYILAVE